MQKFRLYIGLTALFLLSNFAFAFDQSHVQWSDFLRKYIVTEGASSYVNYAEIQKNPSDLKAYLASLEKVSNPEFQEFDEKEQLAFLINAYNAFTIKLVLDHYPVSSIRDIKGDFATPWDKKFFSLLGTRRSLNELEHEVIRKKYNEPRIHFALVCAARGCPALKDEAYQASKLEEQLDRSTAAFLADKSRNFYDSKTKTLHLSEIFSWYKSDFTKSHKSLPAFVARYLPELDEYSHAQIRVDFSKNKYDWGLNDASTRRGPASLLSRNLPDSVLDLKGTGHSRSPSLPSGTQDQYGPPAPNSRGSSPSGSQTESGPSYSTGGSGGGGVGSGTESNGPHGTSPSASGPSPSGGYAGPGSGAEASSTPSGPSGVTGSGTETPPASTQTAGSGTESNPSYTQNSAESRGPTGSGTESRVPTIGSGTESVGTGSESYRSTGSGTESVGSGTESYRSVGSGSETFGAIGSGTESSRNIDDRSRSVRGATTENAVSFDGVSRSPSTRENSSQSTRSREVPAVTTPPSRSHDSQNIQARTVTLDLGPRELSSRPKNTTSSSRVPNAGDSVRRAPANRDRVRPEGPPTPPTGSESPIAGEPFASNTGINLRDVTETPDRERTEGPSPIISPDGIEKEEAPPKSKDNKLLSVPGKKPSHKVIAVKLPIPDAKDGQPKEQVIYIEQDKPISQEEMQAMIKEVIEVLQKLGRVESYPVKEVEAVATVTGQEKLDQYRSVMISTSREQKKVFIPAPPDEELASDTDDSNAEKLRKKRDTRPTSVAPAI